MREAPVTPEPFRFSGELFVLNTARDCPFLRPAGPHNRWRYRDKIESSAASSFQTL
jgi:hypothetical protein